MEVCRKDSYILQRADHQTQVPAHFVINVYLSTIHLCLDYFDPLLIRLGSAMLFPDLLLKAFRP